VKLADVEARFYALVTAPESVAKTLAARGSEARRELEELVAGDARLSAEARLDIYANMYFFRIRDVLAAEYPRTLALLGESAFHNLVTDYLVARPPAHPSLREAGGRLPGFLAAHAAGRERPWLAELARLERTRLEMVDGPDATAVTLQALEQIPAPQFPALHLARVPSSALIANRFAILPQWRGSEDAPEVPEAAPETLLVWRRALDVFHRAVDKEEAECLERVGRGIAFEDLCARLAIGRTDEVAAVRAFELVARWAADGLLREPPPVAGDEGAAF
jgi:hypothetical protein